ncbi:preprotein translocase subunit SecE [Timonella senegalensis]|uniref:preprotein translocase subunit SecE n=1 Tax=Timonella senegalensis TaxID=1465825 RepID=UPI000300B785|nr:preprotein translocase subunit SecE [Timonella senegalensis]
MSESASGAVNGDLSGAPSGKSAASNGAPKKGNIFARIALFVRQVIAELKKVVTPTRSAFINYVTVVIVFVIVVMAFVLVVDAIVSRGTGLLFG